VKAVPEDGIFASVEERLRDERCARRHGDDQVAPVGSTSDDQI
jgi:hypothetical protein